MIKIENQFNGITEADFQAYISLRPDDYLCSCNITMGFIENGPFRNSIIIGCADCGDIKLLKEGECYLISRILENQE